MNKMKGHIKYNKIHRLGKEEVEGILDGEVLLQEKIDGANTSIWMEDDELCFGSRNNQVTDFRGLKDYVLKHKGILDLLKEVPHYRLFGEWLVKHTINYDKTAYQHFYLFDVLDQEKGVFLSPDSATKLAEYYKIKSPQVFGKGKFTEEEIKELVGKSELGPQGEGVVIKNPNYESKFGVRPQYAKLVSQEFTENNAITFGGNNKHSDSYYEQKVCNEFMTLPRVKKVMQKTESSVGRALDKSDTPRIANTSYHDMLEEEIWTIQKKVNSVNFNTLKRLCTKKAIKIFHDLLANPEEVSVAYE